MLKLARKGLAALIGVVIVLTAPGPASYQAFAGENRSVPHGPAQVRISLSAPTRSFAGPPASALSTPGSVFSISQTAAPTFHEVSVSLPPAAAAPSASVSAAAEREPSAQGRMLDRLGAAVSGFSQLWSGNASDSRLKAETGKPFEQGPRASQSLTPPTPDSGGPSRKPEIRMTSPQEGDPGEVSNRGPPQNFVPPPSGGGGASGSGSSGPSTRVYWLAGALALTAAGAAVHFFPGAAASTLAQAWSSFSKDSLAVIASRDGRAVAGLAAAAFVSYYAANAIGYYFPATQVDKVYGTRSANVAMAKGVTGLAASAILVFNFSFLGDSLAASQNLFGSLLFGANVAQKFWYDRHPALPGSPAPSTAQRLVKDAVTIAAAAAATYVSTLGLTAWAPRLPAAGWIFPLGVTAGLGFAYLMLPEFNKIEREKSVGDASLGMAWSYLLATIGVAVWAVYKIVMIAGAAKAAAMRDVLIFTGVQIAASAALTGRLARFQWKFLPQGLKVFGRTISRETLIDAASFAVIAPFMLAAFGAAYHVLGSVLNFTGHSHEFATRLFYVIENVMAAVVTLRTLRAFKKYGRVPAASAEKPK